MSTITLMKELVRWTGCVFLLLIASFLELSAQENTKMYTIRNGKMIIELSKHLKESSLDSFIARYDLYDIGLKHFIQTNRPDSLLKCGWQIEKDNTSSFVVSKPLMAMDNFDNPVQKIIFTEKHPTFAEMFPSVNNGVPYGYNRFRNKFPFTGKESYTLFFLRGNLKAGQVMLAGSFNDWKPNALSMNRTDSGWIGQVKLSPGKYWYKFIVDGNWIVDNDNLLRENDGRGNINSVYYKANILFTLNSFTNAKKVYLAGSFNDWNPKELLMSKTASGWELPLYLPEGTHTYKFVVDGEWHADEANKERLPDGAHGYNSVLRLGKPHLFQLPGYKEAKQVVLSGSFNKWREDELYLQKTSDGWQLPYVLGPGNYEYKFIVDGKWITDPGNPFTVSNQQNTGNSYLIIEPNYTFVLKGYPQAKSVYLAGDFNNWSPNSLPMKRQGDSWVFQVHLSAGKHLYKFIVNGEWIMDPANKLWEQNEYGTGNSIIWIER